MNPPPQKKKTWPWAIGYPTENIGRSKWVGGGGGGGGG